MAEDERPRRTAREMLETARLTTAMGNDHPRTQGDLNRVAVTAAVEQAEALTRIAAAMEKLAACTYSGAILTQARTP